MRKIIQVCSGASQPEYYEPSLYALCGDGTLWSLAGSGWHPIPNVPQRAISDGMGYEPLAATDVTGGER